MIVVFAAAFAAGALGRGPAPAPRGHVPSGASDPPRRRMEALRRELESLEREIVALKARPAAPTVSEAERALAWVSVDDAEERDARETLLLLDLASSAEKRGQLIALWETETDPARLARLETLLADLVFQLDPAFQEALERQLLDGVKGPKALFALKHLDIEESPDPKLLEAIRAYGEDADPLIRRAAVKALREVRSPEVTEWKARLARGDVDPAVRAAAYRGLDFDEERKACIEVASHIVRRESDVRVRQDALAKLGLDLAMTITGLGVGIAPDDQSRLWKILSHAAEKDEDPEVRANAVGLIAVMWRGKALPALEARLPHEPDPRVKENLDTLIQIMKEGHTNLMDFMGEVHKRIRHFQKPSSAFEEEE